jgi:hypothetical protein
MGTDINGPPQAPPSTHGVSCPQKEMGLNDDLHPEVSRASLKAITQQKQLMPMRGSLLRGTI